MRLEDAAEGVACCPTQGSALGDAHSLPRGLCPYCSFGRLVGRAQSEGRGSKCQRFLVFWYGLMTVLLITLGKEGGGKVLLISVGKEGESGPR